MYYLILKLTVDKIKKKIGEYAIVKFITNNPSSKYAYDKQVAWLTFRVCYTNQQIIHFGIDEQDMNDTYIKILDQVKDDPLLRNFWMNKKRRKKRKKKTKAQRIHHGNMMRGKKWTEEQKRNLSARYKYDFAVGIRTPSISYKNQDNPAMRAKMRANPYHTNRPKSQCPHCKIYASINMMVKYHGDKCKNNW